ncbi:MAG TPA: type I polyketide synthase, partial [Polyangiaceae bacterium]|nr:type I polyketide synthase [Polyangiaceae bacterium]
MTAVDERIARVLHDARQALEQERKRRTEPIAIVGIGCRFPGAASSPEQYWRMLCGGVDATGDVPRDRWDADALFDEDADAPGKAYVKRGAFLADIAGFEPEMFGISPREAVGLDPQQRLLLEVCWEALEDAAIAPQALSATATGVWIGQSFDDYARRTSAAGGLEGIDRYSALGTARSVAAGRIAYVLGLNGPVLQVDTSCSSSLVAVHLACQSLRAGECDVALVGGVNLIAAPDNTIALCKLRALARDGRCKTFDARADGYGRGEGCGIIVLKRASDAAAASDRVYAEIRGSALNHDGRSNGLTAPSGGAQEAVLRRALDNAGLAAHDVQYIEAHGTGTLLGDPIELLALNRVFGAGRSAAQPLLVGSAKTNIGHLEAAAGIAGLIKAALSIAQGAIPPHLHLTQPNPKIPWHELPFRVPLETTSWPSHAPRVAGVSSFGMSGTNAHVVLAQAASEAPPVAAPRSASLVVLSARTDEALKQSATQLRSRLDAEPSLGVDEVAATMALGRSALSRRVARVVTSRAQLEMVLANIAAAGARDSDAPRASTGERGWCGGVAWLFPGQGAQLLGMGRALSREFAPFRQGLEQALAALDPFSTQPLASVMWAEAGTPDAALLQQTAFTQPALFAFGWALAALWRSFGISPEWVAGHSLGEITAACVAGVFSLPQAARLVCARGRLMQALAPDGAMLSVELDVDDAAPVIEPHADRVAIAAVNSPGSVVLSGDRQALQQIAEMLVRLGVAHKLLPVSHAFHSPLVEPMLQAFAREASVVDYHTPTIPIVSNLSGALAGPEIQTAEYWVRHVREPVRFAAGVQALQAAGARTFIELGARAVLSPLVQQTLGSSDALFVPSGRSGKPETTALLEAVGVCWQQGASVAWSAVLPPNARRCRLPTYPWQRRRFWQEAHGGRSRPATLLGERVECASGDVLFESSWSPSHPAWVADHRVGDEVVVPAAALVELARAAAESLHGGGAAVRSLLLERALVLQENEPRRVQVLAARGGQRLGIYSRASEPAGAREPMAPWTLHATAELEREPPHASSPEVPEPASAQLSPGDVPELYARLAAVGLSYGPSFRAVERLWSGAQAAIGELRLPAGLDAPARGVHPCLLDAAFQLAAAIGHEPLASRFLPVELHGLELAGMPPPDASVQRQRAGVSARAYVRRLDARTPDTLEISLAIEAAHGPLASIERVVFRRVAAPILARPVPLHELSWRVVPSPPPAPASGRWTLLQTPRSAPLADLSRALNERGARCALASTTAGDGARFAHSPEHLVCFWDRDGSVDTALEVAREALEIVQRVLSSGERPRVWWVTRGAVRVLPHEVSQPSL